jgi:hypothetical protein
MPDTASASTDQSTAKTEIASSSSAGGARPAGGGNLMSALDMSLHFYGACHIIF